MRRIGGLLGRSPYGPVHEHMLKVQDCAGRLAPALEAFLAGDYPRAGEISAEISRLEHEADAIKTETREELSHSLFSAVERGEVLALLKAQDDVADACQDAARLLELRRMSVPAALGRSLLALGAGVKTAADAMTETTRRLAAIPESPSPRDAMADALSAADQVRSAEHDTEERGHATLKELFALERELDSVAVVLLMKLIGKLAEAAHSAENAADAIGRLLGGR